MGENKTEQTNEADGNLIGEHEKAYLNALQRGFDADRISIGVVTDTRTGMKHKCIVIRIAETSEKFLAVPVALLITEDMVNHIVPDGGEVLDAEQTRAKAKELRDEAAMEAAPTASTTHH